MLVESVASLTAVTSPNTAFPLVTMPVALPDGLATATATTASVEVTVAAPDAVVAATCVATLAAVPVALPLGVADMPAIVTLATVAVAEAEAVTEDIGTTAIGVAVTVAEALAVALTNWITPVGSPSTRLPKYDSEVPICPVRAIRRLLPLRYQSPSS